MTLGPNSRSHEAMQRNIPMPALWDAEFPKQRMQAAIEHAKYAQSEQDWQTAHIYVERVIADKFDRHHFCELSRCRRARHCIGNPPLCWGKRMREQRMPAKVQDSIEKGYALIQQERAAAARGGRAPRVLRPVTRRVRGKPTVSSPGSTARPSIPER
jgi:hypothetical protein